MFWASRLQCRASSMRLRHKMHPYAAKAAYLSAVSGRPSYSQLSISPKVQEALDRQMPVVCLESTIITHGMSYPANFAMAKAVEQVIEDHGAVPATIAILNGKACIGLEENDLELLAMTGQKARKVSRRDLASALADKATGGTTVSGTMILAKKAGIKVFVTGGIGGVHRKGEFTMDVSNDLNELSRNDVAVVCAGPKAILDIPRTLEYLETMGVTVTTVGQRNLPAFFSRDSGLKSPQVSSSAEHAANMIYTNQQLELNSSILVCVPIPEASSIDSAEMSAVIKEAVLRADQLGIEGKDITPFLLAAVSTATQGRSLKANIALVMENAKIGAQIACCLAKKGRVSPVPDSVDARQSSMIADSIQDLEEGFSINVSSSKSLQEQTGAREHKSLHDNLHNVQQRRLPESSSSILVVGGVAVDTTCSIDAANIKAKALQKTSYPGTTSRSLGGVAGNIARAIARTGSPVILASVIGGSETPSIGSRSSPEQLRTITDSVIGHTPDVDGTFILAELQTEPIHLSIQTNADARTATYTCIQADGELAVAVADMAIFDSAHFDLAQLQPAQHYKAIVIDANIPGALVRISDRSISADIVCFEPTSVPKAAELFTKFLVANPDSQVRQNNRVWPQNFINMTTPNTYELQALFESARSASLFESDEWWDLINSFNITSTFQMKLEHFLRKQKELKIDLVEKGSIQQAIHLLPFLENIYLTLGSSGVMSFHLRTDKDSSCAPGRILEHRGTSHMVQIVYHPAISGPSTIINDTGCGDTFTGVLVSALAGGNSLYESTRLAQQAALLTLGSASSVSSEIDMLFEK